MANFGYAIGGLGEGLAQGLALGSEMQERQLQRQKMQRQEQDATRKGALELFLAGTKIEDTNPEAAQQIFSQVWPALTGGQPWKQGDSGKNWTDRYKAMEAQVTAAFPNMNPAERTDLVRQKLGFKSFKTGKEEEKHYMMTPQGPVAVPPGKYHNPPGSVLPTTYFDPLDPSKQTTFGGGQHVRPMPPPPASQTPSTTETESGLTAGDLKPYEAMETKYNATTDPKERAVIEKRIAESGGTIEKIPQPASWGGWGSAQPDKIIVVPPTTKKRTTTKTPGLGGVPEPVAAGVDTNAVKAKAKELIQKGKDPAKVKAWAKTKFNVDL